MANYMRPRAVERIGISLWNRARSNEDNPFLFQEYVISEISKRKKGASGTYKLGAPVQTSVLKTNVTKFCE